LIKNLLFTKIEFKIDISKTIPKFQSISISKLIIAQHPAEMKRKSIIGISVTSSGTLVTLKSHSFTVSSSSTENSSSKTVETSVGKVHKEPCSTLCTASSGSSEADSHSDPSVFLCSRGLLSSWEPKRSLNGEYAVVSKVPILSSTQSATLMCIWKKSVLAVSYVDSSIVDIFAIAENLGLSHFRSLHHNSQVQSMTLISDERGHFVLVAACHSEIIITNIMDQNGGTYKLASSNNLSSSSKADSLITATYDNETRKGFIGHYEKDGDFQLLMFKINNEKDADKKDGSCFYKVVKISEVKYPLEARGLAIDFINDNERLCIVVSVSDIFIIDSLQRCIVKKINVASLLQDVVDESQVSDPLHCSIGAISFPFVGIHSMLLSVASTYKLDAAFALAGSLQAPQASSDQNNPFRPLVMSDQSSIDLMNSKFSGTVRKQKRNDESRSVRSSGYCNIVESKMGHCPSNLKRMAQMKATKSKVARKHKTEKLAKTKYPIDADFIDSHQEQHDDTECKCLLPPLAAISFDSYGESLAVSTVDKGLHILKLPMSKYGSGTIQAMNSHPSVEGRRAPLTSCRPSWSSSLANKMIAFDNKVYSLSASMKSMQVMCDLGDDASNASFCFKDKILIHSTKNKLFLKQSTFSNSRENFSKFSLSKLFENSQRINSVASLNAVETNIIAVSCSDKSLSIVDIETGSILWSQNYAAGSRPANFITFPQVSDNIPLTPCQFNLLLATSCDEGGTASLWDLRCGELVKTFKGHKNRRDQCLGSFSPCMRYIGVGGEGNCASAVLYDIRGCKGSKYNSELSTVQSNLGKNKNNVPFRDGSIIDVQFHPLYPQLVTSSLSGRLRWYKEAYD
jgi:hypothetical protein